MSEDEYWYFVPVNPEPWAVGPLSVGRSKGSLFPRMGRNEKLHFYKESFRDALVDPIMLPDGLYDLKFFFWRRLDQWTGGAGRSVTAHIADATNMQKATEDALQGLIIKNDASVHRVSSEIMAQSTEIEGRVVIRATPYIQSDYVNTFPRNIIEQIIPSAEPKPEVNRNAWPPV